MRSISYTAIGASLLIVIAGCGDGGDGDNVVRRKGEPDMIRVDSDNKKINAAIQQARLTVGDFITALQSPKTGESSFAVKKRFPIKGDNAEHIWLSDVSFDGKQFHGKINNEPVDAKGVKLGEPATVAPSDISDWMYVRNGKLVGGYTIRALYDLSSPAGRNKFTTDTGLRLD